MKGILFLLLVSVFCGQAQAGELVKDVPGSFQAIEEFSRDCKGDRLVCDQEVMERYHKLIGDLSGDVVLLCLNKPEEKDRENCKAALQRALEAVSETRTALAATQKTINGGQDRTGIFAVDREILRGYARALAAMLGN